MTKIVNEDREIRRRPSCIVECPRCGNEVKLIAETTEWRQTRTGRWIHIAYGPGTGECCELVFLDDPFDGVKVFKLDAKR